jgi:hypothetical protein
MVTGPGDVLAAAAAGRGYLRVSHAEREQAIETLKAAFAHGMLAKDEFDLRAGQEPFSPGRRGGLTVTPVAPSQAACRDGAGVSLDPDEGGGRRHG